MDMRSFKTNGVLAAALLAAGMFVFVPLSACSATGDNSGDAVISQTGPSGEGTGEDSASGGSVAGKIALTEEELNNRIASYTYKGKTYEVTALEVINSSTSLENLSRGDGTYSCPTADDTLAYVRNHLLLDEAESRGITASAEEITAYANETFGSNDFAIIGANYGMDAETVERLIGESAIMSKLRNQILGDTGEAVAPDMPSDPVEGQEDVATAEYASYIISLAGDEWDAQAGTWSGKGGEYETALATYEITADAASYEAAMAAYYVAVSKYSTAMGEQSTLWTDFVNGILGSATITIETLAA